MRSYIQFITTPTADTPGTLLLLHFDSSRYLIGQISEGTQRACVQRAIGLRKISSILLTGRTEWANTGGLLGLILTAADSKESAAEAVAHHEAQKFKNKTRDHGDAALTASKKGIKERPEIQLNLHGAPNLEHTIATARRFVFRKGLPLNTIEHAASDFEASTSATIQPTWTDENIRVYVMSLLPFDGLNPEEREITHVNEGAVESHDSGKEMHLSSANIMKSTNSLPSNSMDGSDTDGKSQQSGMQPETVSTNNENYDRMRRAIVCDMFDSSWHLDTLIEMPLSRVQLPATLFVRDPTTKGLQEYHGPLPGNDELVPDINVFIRKPWPSALVKELPPTKPALEALSYIVRNHPQRGRFLPKKANELGIKGVKCAILTSGESVQNDKGDLITPEMVLESGREGAGIAIVDIPNRNYIEALIQRPEWNDSDVMDGVAAFIWILGLDVATDPRIRQFQQKWSHLRHIVSSPGFSRNSIALESAASSAIRHNLIDAQIFPVPIHEIDDGNPNVDQALTIQAKAGLGLLLEPRIESLEKEIVKPFSASSVKSELSAEVLPLINQHAFPSTLALQEFVEWSKTIPNSDAEIITLGTGSALPSKYRNVSATLVRVPGCGSYLFDCGENTLGTLKRLYSPSDLTELLKDLKMIWISHLHADHHLGTTSVIKAWYHAVHNGVPEKTSVEGYQIGNETEGTRLAIVSDAPMLHWLYEYSSVEDYGYSRILPLAAIPLDLEVDPNATSSLLQIATSPSELGSQSVNMLLRNSNAKSANLGETVDARLTTNVFLEKLHLKSLATVRVSHCRGAQAVSVTFNSGLKVSYSGDCRPSYDHFGRIGKDSHILIHEATFEDELLGDAKAKKHSTISEALGVARVMNARACILTHFSQRYQKVPILNEDSESTTKIDILNGNAQDFRTQERPDFLSPAKRLICVVAFDYMRVKIRDLPRLEILQPLLNRVYANLSAKENLAEEEKKTDLPTKKNKAPETQSQNKKQKKMQAPQKRQEISD